MPSCHYFAGQSKAANFDVVQYKQSTVFLIIFIYIGAFVEGQQRLQEDVSAFMHFSTSKWDCHEDHHIWFRICRPGYRGMFC